MRLKVKSIRFAHTPDDKRSGIPLRRNFEDSVSDPEYRVGACLTPADSPAAYTIDQINAGELTIICTFAISGALGSRRTLVRAVHPRYTSSSRGNIVGDPESTVLCSGDVICTLTRRSGQTAPVVGIEETEWLWQYSTDDGNSWDTFDLTRHRIYVLANYPQEPWDMNGQSQPWTDALDIACKLSEGLHHPGDVPGRLVTKLYRGFADSDIVYINSTINVELPTYYFSKVLSKLNTTPVHLVMNCEGWNGLVVLLGTLLGASLYLRPVESRSNSKLYFQTIKLLGYKNWGSVLKDNGIVRSYFNYHRVACDHPTSPDPFIYDSILAFPPGSPRPGVKRRGIRLVTGLKFKEYATLLSADGEDHNWMLGKTTRLSPEVKGFICNPMFTSSTIDRE